MAQVLRGLPRDITAAAPVAFALRAAAALRAANFGAFLRLWGRGTWAQRALMALRLLLHARARRRIPPRTPRNQRCQAPEPGARAAGAHACVRGSWLQQPSMELTPPGKG